MMRFLLVSSTTCIFFLRIFLVQAVAEEPAPSPDCIQEKGESIYRVNRSCMEQHLDNLSPIIKSITVSPHLKDGRCLGMAISAIQGGSIFLDLGLQVGDIITHVNGKPLNGAGPPTVQPYEELKQPEHLELDILRDNKPTTLRYEFE
jgi:type II secretory pathway component PulC